jgi:diguanylate cyclase (GGDEF)-like protein/PAS domain S-box-containing protein
MTEQEEILIVDDTPIVVELLTGILSAEGFRVRSAENGEQALDLIAAEPPQLILLDIKMPGINGFEVCRQLKSQAKTRNIPIIFISVIMDFEEKVKGFGLGAVDYISKPFQRDELLARVRTHLELRRLRTNLEAQVEERTAQLRILAEEVEDLYENAPCGYHSLDVGGVFLRINDTALEWLGYTRDELIGKMKFSDLIVPKDLPLFREKFLRFKTQGYLRDLELEIVRKDDTTFPVLLNVSGIRDSQEGYLMTRSVMFDITERKRMEEILKFMSLKDDLTGLYNRRGFFALAEQGLKAAQRMRKEMLAIFSDLDDTKKINDTLGHKEGDQALKDTSRILKETFRESDIIARLGGDEFGILAMNGHGESAEKLIARLEMALNDHNAQRNRSYTLSLSLGIARFDPQNPCTIDALLTRADKMMYRNKQKRHAKSR